MGTYSLYLLAVYDGITHSGHAASRICVRVFFGFYSACCSVSEECGDATKRESESGSPADTAVVPQWQDLQHFEPRLGVSAAEAQGRTAGASAGATSHHH